MTLSQRTILIIVSTFIALLFILATSADFILLSSYAALEKSEITSQATHISNRISDKLRQLDETAQEINARLNETGVRSHQSGKLFTEYFLRSHGIDIAALYDRSGRLISIGGFDCENNRLCPVSARDQQTLAALVTKFRAGSYKSVRGIIKLGNMPLMMTLHQRENSIGEQPGYVALGWFIDKVEIEQTFRASGLTIDVSDLKGALEPDVQKASAALVAGVTGGYFASVIDENSVAAYFNLKDIFGTPSFIVKITEKRVLHEQGKATIAYIFTALALAGSVFCLVMLVFIRRSVLTRLQSLTALVREIAERRTISARIPDSNHRDELKSLADSINSMLESLERSEDAMRESEERYRMLFEQAPDAIIIIGLEGEEAGRIVAANRAAADQHGYSISELCAMPIYDLNTAETNTVAGDIISRVTGGEWVTTELWHRKKDGSKVPVEVHAGLIKMSGKKYILGFDRDITQRKIAEETDRMHLERIRLLNNELQQKATALETVNQELETFNYSVSHDMRGPLTRISGYCQLLLDDDHLEPGVKEYISRIYESEQWLNDMIDALLQIAQVNRVEIVSDAVNLSSIAVAALQELQLQHPERAVRTRVDDTIAVGGDPRLLKMMMINLLSNAWKYSAYREEAFIEFGADLTESGPVFYVRDNGAGFEMKDAGKLFRVFSRLHDASRFSGTGIGLATVQRIIFRHGGLIWVESEPDCGTTFYFTLPQHG